MKSRSSLRIAVVGSGLAGLSCAEALAREGFRVTVFTPAVPGRDGATHRVCRHAPWVLLSAPGAGRDEADFHAELLRRGGRPELAGALAGEARRTAMELSKVLDLVPLDRGPIRLPGDAVARGHRFHCRSDGPLLRPLLERCRENGVRVRSHRLVIGLLEKDGRAVGVVSVPRGCGETEALRADAVVLASGGTGGLFPISTEPRWCGGSSLALAAVVGADLDRAHLCQPLPVWRRPLFFPSSRTLLEGELLAGGDRLPAVADLAALTRAIAELLRQDIEVRHRPRGAFGDGPGPGFRGLTLAAHHGIGGVAVDPWGRSSVRGLYVCGEAAGGIQGERRMMGTGLLEARLFGSRAATAVATDLLDGLGPAPAGGVAKLAAPEPLTRAARVWLDAALASLVAIRPEPEVARLVARLAEAPPESGSGRGGSWREALRWQAARLFLASELAARRGAEGEASRDSERSIA